MDLSARMPAQQPATQDARIEARREPAPTPTGGDGPAVAPQGSVTQQSSGGVPYEATDVKKGSDWQTADNKTGPADGWQLQDRKN